MDKEPAEPIKWYWLNGERWGWFGIAHIAKSYPAT